MSLNDSILQRLKPVKGAILQRAYPGRGSISVGNGHTRDFPTTPEGLHTVTHDESPTGDFTTTDASSGLQICIL